ncbi:hypothetical protein C6501_17675 [Candidatus Poribacteria bacterium]|nr:MAG: hypothetical protein C6501_17675 [Candidatus Poribacteria bacterium]
MKTILFVLLTVIFLCAIVSHGNAFEYHWEIDETPEGQESTTVVEPIQVTILDEQIQLLQSTATYFLLKKYSVYPDLSWDKAHTDRLLKTFESIPQLTNDLYGEPPLDNISIWKLIDQHIQNDIKIEYTDGRRIVTISKHAFVYANPLLAEIEGVRGRYFSKRLHRAVVRFVTDNGTNRSAIKRILRDRYAVSIDVPDYVELTQYTTSEHAGRFSTFKNEELIALVSMLEEFPSGMLKTPGLKYLVRRLDGTPHPLYPQARAVAWTSAGYIEFMESAFKGQGLDYIHRLILHEKAHFLWAYLFDEQLKQDWIELGGWYENPDDVDGWSTTKQNEFVSAYAHGKNPNEDMAESISFYIVRPDKLRSRSPAKYEFIQNRIMHGTHYISKIREDLTFEVYNLYPDYVYPGRIVRVNVRVDGEPEEDKEVTIEVELHSESDHDTVHGGLTRIYSGKNSYIDVYLYPIDSSGQQVNSSHILCSKKEKISKYAAKGYWIPDQISIWDANQNSRYNGISDFGWSLYIDNPLADCDPPEYVPNSLKLSLRKSTDEESAREGGEHQIVTVKWLVREDNNLQHVFAALNDNVHATYSRELFEYGQDFDRREDGLIEVQVDLEVPDYHQSGTYAVNRIGMRDIAGNPQGVYFTEPNYDNYQKAIDELPVTIEIHTKNPDSTPPVLDLENITITAEPTNPEEPNGETNVHITFRVKDDISGYSGSEFFLRDPLGVMHTAWHWISNTDFHRLYFEGDPTVYTTYENKILLPVGSAPGTWGLAEMTVTDKARNTLHADFTEIIRFEVDDGTVYAKYDINEDGAINILDLVIIASFDASNERSDVNGDGTVNILDLVVVASNFGEEDIAAPATNSPTVAQIQSWLTQAMQANDGSPAFRRGIRTLQNLLLSLRPETTTLLPNYPNPFNPETWIPYHLANASDVQITIYDMGGSIVRTLSLGHRAAGYYTDRDRAAYWDGRNGLGERTASGIYFYQLQADNDVSQMRKLVIVK